MRSAWRCSQPGSSASAPWRPDLIALERQLRTEIRPAEPSRAPARVASNDDEILRRVRALIADSERKQQSDFVLHFTELMRDMNSRRNADLARISYSLGAVQNSQRSTASELLKNRSDINYLAVLATQR